MSFQRYGDDAEDRCKDVFRQCRFPTHPDEDAVATAISCGLRSCISKLEGIISNKSIQLSVFINFTCEISNFPYFDKPIFCLCARTGMRTLK